MDFHPVERDAAVDAALATPARDTPITIELGYRPPYDVTALLRFVARRAIPDVEQVFDRRIRRSVRAGTVLSRDGWIEVEFDPVRPVVRLCLPTDLAAASGRIVTAVRRWLDLDCAAATIDAALRSLPGAPGLRLPGSLDAFEIAVRAVLGQQVTVGAARTLAKRFVERFGTPLATPWPEIVRVFPAPARFAAVAPSEVAELGIIRARAAAILALAQAWPELSPVLSTHDAPAAPLVAALVALPGIGPWTAHYIAMRALGWPDAFPPNDIAVLNAMRALFGTDSPRAAEAASRDWQPWRSYAVLRLWNSLEKTP